MAPSTPPPPASRLLAALTTASTASSVISPSTTSRVVTASILPGERGEVGVHVVDVHLLGPLEPVHHHIGDRGHQRLEHPLEHESEEKHHQQAHPGPEPGKGNGVDDQAVAPLPRHGGADGAH